MILSELMPNISIKINQSDYKIKFTNLEAIGTFLDLGPNVTLTFTRADIFLQNSLNKSKKENNNGGNFDEFMKYLSYAFDKYKKEEIEELKTEIIQLKSINDLFD